MTTRAPYSLTFAAVAMVLGLSSCATPGEAPPPQLRAASAQTRAGEEAYLMGRPADAIPALTEAVRLHLAAGDLPGAAGALLNLALAQRGAGDASAAAATATRLRELTPAARQQAHEQSGKDNASAELDEASTWLDALLALGRGDTTTATGLLASPTLKGTGSSPWPGRLETLRAELALGDGRFAEALTHARAGQAASNAAHDRAEEARALRLAGTARVRLNQWMEARTDFLASLRIEGALGGGARMAGDLDQLAAISEHLGDPGEAQLYTQRARAITAARIR